eukprot:gene2052-1558_t
MTLRTPPNLFSDRLSPINRKSIQVDLQYFQTEIGELQPKMMYIMQVLKKLKIQKDSKIIDLGCGSGFITEFISKQGFKHVTGLDISEEAIDLAQEKDKKSKYILASINNIPLKDESMDVVIMTDVLPFLLNLRRTFKEIRRILKPNGLLIFDSISRTRSTYNMLRYSHSYPKTSFDYRLFVTPQEVKKLFKEFNFEMEEIQGIENKSVSKLSEKITFLFIGYGKLIKK